MDCTIIHIDMDAFFASVEQRCNPKLRGRPIAVIGSAQRTVVTTASYEARRYGVRTGMNKYEAKRVCPELIFVIGNNQKYTDTSLRILNILKGFSPLVEVYSIDEAFMDITGSIVRWRTPEEMVWAIKERIKEELGLTCSVGIGPNKLLAKLASNLEKPDGLVSIGRGQARRVLERLPVGELWGIGERLAMHLKKMGIETCGHLGRYPASLLRRRFGIIGERLKLMGQGIDLSPVIPVGKEKEAKSIGHSMTLPRDIADGKTIRIYLLHLSEMVGRRARKYHLKGGKVSLTIRYPDFHTFSRQKTISISTNDTHLIYQYALSILDSIRLKNPVRLLGLSISQLTKEDFQIPLFGKDRLKERLLETIDMVNDSYGEFTLQWASLLERGRVHGVISPSWRPEGTKRVDVR